MPASLYAIWHHMDYGMFSQHVEMRISAECTASSDAMQACIIRSPNVATCPCLRLNVYDYSDQARGHMRIWKASVFQEFQLALNHEAQALNLIKGEA